MVTWLANALTKLVGRKSFRIMIRFHILPFRTKQTSMAGLKSWWHRRYFGWTVRPTYSRRLGSGSSRRSFSIKSLNKFWTFSLEKEYSHCFTLSVGYLSSLFDLGTAWYVTWLATRANVSYHFELCRVRFIWGWRPDNIPGLLLRVAAVANECLIAPPFLMLLLRLLRWSSM